jgi:PD-(D/E)XK nuclease superfamily
MILQLPSVSCLRYLTAIRKTSIYTTTRLFAAKRVNSRSQSKSMDTASPPIDNRSITTSSASSTAEEDLNTPIDFSSGFKVPVFTHPLSLEVSNAHPRDRLLQFNPSEHTYKIEGVNAAMSVTQACDYFFESFDGPLIATKMVNSRNWPRPDYMVNEENRPMTVEEILDKWDKNGELARNQGTWMHYNIEKYLNGLDVVSSEEMEYFLSFYREKMDGRVEPYRTEWRIACAEESLAGSVDFVGKWTHTGNYIIIDWKRSKDFPHNLDGNNHSGFARPPLSHLADTKRSKYSLQLNLYKYILEKHYSIKVDKLVCVSFHPAIGSFSYFEADDVSDVMIVLTV